MLQNIDWIFFDVGGVLMDESAFLQWRQNNDWQIVQKFLPAVTFGDIKNSWPQASADDGPLDVNLLRVMLSAEQFSQALDLLHQSFLDSPDYYAQPIRPEALPTLQQLSQKFKLGIIANQSSQAKQKLEAEGIAQYLHTAEMSEHLQVDKPNPEIFTTVLKNCGALPERSVMVDDNIERGLSPAKKLGMKTVWFKTEERNVPEDVVDEVITNLSELPTLFN